MAVRAMWKGVIRFGEVEVPVKLYSALEDRTVHFRLLHAADEVPVEQELVNPARNEVVPYARTKRGFVTEENALVVLEPEELEEVEPEPSRDIEVVCFLPPGAIHHRWYVRLYWLGPDGSEDAYAALVAALTRSKREGLARWTMRNRAYVGALRLHRGHPMLVTLRSDEQIASTAELPAPEGPELDPKELEMAHRLMEMLAEPFEPESYEDEYRERVLELVAAKARGETIDVALPPAEERDEDLERSLRASLESLRA